VNGVGWDVLLVLAVILIGGFFAAAEMALVSLREGQVRALARRGKRGERAARLAQDPNRFLSSVQIGVTLATLLSGAFGAALLSDRLSDELSRWMPRGVAGPVGLIAVTLVISFFTLVFGELAPKRLALQRAERVSLVAGPVVDRVSILARPLVWLLSKSTNGVVQLLGGDPAALGRCHRGERLPDHPGEPWPGACRQCGCRQCGHSCYPLATRASAGCAGHPHANPDAHELQVR